MIHCCSLDRQEGDEQDEAMPGGRQEVYRFEGLDITSRDVFSIAFATKTWFQRNRYREFPKYHLKLRNV